MAGAQCLHTLSLAPDGSSTDGPTPPVADAFIIVWSITRKLRIAGLLQ